jgi:hypothetical protein
MANPRIEVEIGAKVEGLTAGVNTATGQLDKLGKAAQATAPQVQKLTQATSGYNSVGIDFARIVQDAPFGIIGVGNNIQQLAGSFQSLKNSTGSTSAALKQAFASIFSSGNALVLGISVLTSVLTVLQQKGFFKTEESAKSLSDTLEKYRETLDAVTRTSIEGQANAAKEIQSFTLLRAQAENTNISLENRREAVAQLQKQYPEYLKGLSEEQILTGQVGNAYNELTKGLIATAKARAASDQIAKNSLDTLTILAQEEDRALKILQERDKLESIVANKGKVTGQDLLALKNQESIQQQKINTLIREQLDSAEQRNKIETENSNLTSQINLQLSQGAVFTKEKTEQTKKSVKANEDLKRTFEDLSKIDPFISFANLERGGNFFEGVEKQLVSIESGVARTRGIYQENISAISQSNQALVNSLSGSGISVEQFYAAIANGAAEGFTSLNTFISSLSETQAFINETFAILEQGAENTLGDVAFAIGDALASGNNVLKAAGGALLGGIAGILNQLGQLAIATGLAVEGIKKALQTLNPAVAIGAGIALVALAGFVSNKAKSLGGGARGGGGGGGSSVGSSGVGGGTAFTGGGAQGGLFEQNRDVSGEFVVKGQDLVYVLGQANNRINKG